MQHSAIMQTRASRLCYGIRISACCAADAKNVSCMVPHLHARCAGNDLNENTTPLEASLKWTIGKRRLANGCDFLGGDVVKKQIEDGITKRRVGILSVGAPARAGAKLLLAENDKEVGEMTSGAFSPNLKKNVGMGYVDKPYDKVGTKLKVVVRGKQNAAEVAKMPFIPTTYYKG